MQRVFVLDKHKNPLMPCHPARARQLLKKGKAAVYRRSPFTIILKDREGGNTQPTALKLDPGSRITGIALLALFKRGWVVIWAAHLHHRGLVVKRKLDRRRGVRRSRRHRKTRYRPLRFKNRTRPKGWLPPSLQSRVDNVSSWARKVIGFVPITQLAVETVRFDPQQLQNPEIEGIAYQRGELFGYEVREYLLEKWEHKCAYCDAMHVPLEVDHISPRSRGGSSRVSNLTIACRACNQAKGARDVREFLAHDPPRLSKVLAQARRPLKDAAAVNTSRYAIGDALKMLGVPIRFWSGGRTKYNRVSQSYQKVHWMDAVCVGETGERVYVPSSLSPLLLKATGRGSRQMCLMDQHGFPRTSPKQFKRVHGFQTGDLVKAIVSKGRKAGTHIGRVAVRASGSFRVGKVDGISWRDCYLLHRMDGYEVVSLPFVERRKAASSPDWKSGVSAAEVL